MKTTTKTKVLQQAWCWISLSLNLLILFITVSIVSKTVKFCLLGILASVGCIVVGVFNLIANLSKGPPSNASIIIDYTANALISIAITCRFYSIVGWIIVLTIAISLVAELLIAIIIAKRQRILRKIKSLLHR